MNLALQVCDQASKNPFYSRLLEHLKPLEAELVQDLAQEGAYSHLLRLDQHGLSLQDLQPEKGEKLSSPTKVDFLSAELEYRRKTSGKSQGLAKAVGLNKYPQLTVLDATAGFGRDAFILASLGCQVIMLERSPLMYALLLDGLHRAQTDGDADIRETINRMTLHHSDAIDWLQATRQGSKLRPDVIYLDPMFPSRSKSAKVKKDIALLQDVIGIDEDHESLLAAARHCADKRVVVKRPGREGKKNSEAHFQIKGKSAHFEVYTTIPTVMQE